MPSVHYLVSLYDNPMLGATNARINDVSCPKDGKSLVNGNFVVQVPMELTLTEPKDLQDLLTSKYSAYLLWFAGFSHIAYDPLLDTAHIDFTDPLVRGTFGERSTIQLDVGARLTSTVVNLVGPAPSQAVVVWDCYTYEDKDPRTGIFERFYQSVEPDSVSTCEVSFDGGSSYQTVLNGGVLNIPVNRQGTNFIVRIANSTSKRLGLSSWAVLY